MSHSMHFRKIVCNKKGLQLSIYAQLCWHFQLCGHQFRLFWQYPASSLVGYPGELLKLVLYKGSTSALNVDLMSTILFMNIWMVLYIYFPSCFKAKRIHKSYFVEYNTVNISKRDTKSIVYIFKWWSCTCWTLQQWWMYKYKIDFQQVPQTIFLALYPETQERSYLIIKSLSRIVFDISTTRRWNSTANE